MAQARMTRRGRLAYQENGVWVIKETPLSSGRLRRPSNTKRHLVRHAFGWITICAALGLVAGSLVAIAYAQTLTTAG